MSAGEFRVVRVLAKGLVVLARNGDEALWTCGTARKICRCEITGEQIEIGDDRWAPLGNQMYRMDRISEAGMRQLCKSAKVRTA